MRGILRGCHPLYNQQYMNHQSPQLTEAFKLKGYLDKKSTQLLVGWQARYWVILGIDLLYYHDSADKDIKGKFIIKKIQAIQEQDSKLLTFVYDDRKYELRAPNAQERDRWVRGLRAIKKYVGEDIISEPNSPTKLPQVKSSSSLRDFSDILSAQQEAYIVIQEQMQQNKSSSDVIRNLGLKDMASKFSTKRICNRVVIAQTKDSYLVVFSCKSLDANYDDGEILSQQQTNPFQLNTLYKVKIGSEKVKEVCKTASIFSVEYEEGDRILKINCGKRIEFLLKEKGNKDLPQKIKRAAEVGREYHNTKNISLNTNIGPLTKLYETNQGSELKEKAKIYLENKYATLLKSLYKDYSTLQTFSQFFQQVALFEKDYLNAFQVSTSKNPAMISDFEEFIHGKIHRLLTEFWDQKHQSLSPEDILQLARTIDEYRRITNKYVKDHILDNGIGALVRVYLRSFREIFIKEIKRLRASISSNSFSNEVYNFLYRQLSRVVSCCQSQQALTQVVEFIDDCYKIWIEEMVALTQKQSNPDNLVLNLIEINEFNSRVFTQLKDYILNNGLDALSFDDALNETEIIAAQKSLTLHIIQRVFKVLFSNIDRNIISQNLMKIDFEVLVTEINRKVDALKSVGTDEIKEIRKEIANQLLQFQLNLIIGYQPEPKDKIENIVRKINTDKSMIERELVKVVEKGALEKQMEVVTDLVEFLSSDSLISIRKHFKSLKKSLPCLFTLVTAQNLLNLKTHLTKQEKSKLYSVCVDILSSDTEPSEVVESSKKESMLESYALSSRRSTLTLSIERRVSIRPTVGSVSKESISGYLKKKKVDNRSIKRIYERRYFTILEGHLLWYLNESSVELHNKIDLRHLKLVALHETKKDVFYLHLDDCAYQFKAESNVLCQEWVRVLKSYVVAERGQAEAITINDDTELFKDYNSSYHKNTPKLMILQSTRESVLSQMSNQSKLKERHSPSPSSPPKSPTKSVIEKGELMTERKANAPFIKKQSLNMEHAGTESRGCWAWFKKCIS